MNRVLRKINKYIVIAFVFAIILVAISIHMIPRLYTQKKLSDLRLEDVLKIVYVEYEGKPLSSPVKSKKYCILDEDDQLVRTFLKLYKDGDINVAEPAEESSSMLFFYLEDGAVVNAYVAGDVLGFQYGKYWIKVDGVDSIISSMETLEHMSVEKLSINFR